MPYRKLVSSLEDLCLQMVITHFDSMQSRLLHQPPMFINNVYRKLPRTRVKDYVASRRFDSDIFVHSQSESLSHLHQFDLSLAPLLARIGNVCHNLLDLDLRFDATIKPESIIRLLRDLPRIQTLNFEGPACTDKVVAAISTHCPRLRSLDISFSNNFTDIGAYKLSTMELENLNVCATSATVNGCFHILNNLPLLKYFENDHWIELFKKANSNGTFRTYAVSLINPLMTAYRADLGFADMTTRFPRLRGLVACSLEQFDTMGESMQRVTELILFEMTAIDIGLIDRLCPSLKLLHFYKCSINDASISHSPFRNLHLLDVRGVGNRDGVDITESQMQKLLVNLPNLNHLQLMGFEGSISSNFISNLVDLDICRKLKVLLLTSFRFNLTAILKLIGMRSPLEKLGLTECYDTDISDYIAIRDYVKNNNLNLQVDYSPIQDDLALLTALDNLF